MFARVARARIGLGAMAISTSILLAGTTRGACAASGDPRPAAAASRAVAESASMPGNGGAPVTRGLQDTIDAALADAAKRTGLRRADLKVSSAQAVTWPDGSLGCPSPGRSYTQALVPGYRIMIQAGATTLDYHADTRQRLVLCKRRAGAPPSPRPHV